MTNHPEELTISQGLRARHSVRIYRPEPLDDQVLRSILDDALSSPSAKNTQPWHVWVLRGPALEHFRTEAARALTEGRTEKLHTPNGSSRSQSEARRLWTGLLKATTQTGLKSNDAIVRSVRFFDAPVVVLITASRDDLPEGLIDIGIFTQSIALAAAARGVDNCIVGYIRMVASAIRPLVGWPEDHELIIGLALGRSDDDNPLNRFRSERLPLDEVATFVR